jgi:outer membrane lipoprotein-sorting protein
VRKVAAPGSAVALPVAAVLAIAALACGAAIAAAPPPLDKILSGYVEARGGLSALNGTHTMRASGTMTLGGAAPVPFTLEVRRPDKIRLEYRTGGTTVVRAYDGKHGFSLVQREGAPLEPKPMMPDEERLAAEQADLAGPLILPRTKGNKVEWIGEEVIDGRRTYALRVTPKGRTPRTIWLDAETLLNVQEEGTRRSGSTDVAYVIRTADWRKVAEAGKEARVAVPFRIETGLKDGRDRQVFLFEKVELDVSLSNARFAPPVESKR